MSEGQKFKIFVQDFKGAPCSLSVNENDTIASLKQKIKQKLSIKDDQVFEIHFNGEFLEEKDEETSSPKKISDYEIYDGITVHTTVGYGQKPNLENNNDNNKIDNQIIEENIKEKINKEKEGDKQITNIDNETKTNNEEDIELHENNEKNLDLINKEINSPINDMQKNISEEMERIEEQQFTIAVKDSKNQSIYVSVDKDELITNLKSKIKKQLGIKDNENIELIHNVNILDDNGKISDYGIENNSEIIWTLPVLDQASSSNIKMHNKKNDNRKKDKKINWKLILLGLLFFVCAGLAWYLWEVWFLIGGLAFAGLVFFGLSFIWLKSCIGCTKIDILKKQENKSQVKNSPGLGDIPRESDNTLSQEESKK